LNFLSLSGWHDTLPTDKSSVFIILGHAVAEIVTDYHTSVVSKPPKTKVLFGLYLFGRHNLWYQANKDNIHESQRLRCKLEVPDLKYRPRFPERFGSL
jgi:hypothetical protein